jgi:CENP-Q, a CENPA-CAD centromere complex subunit
MGKGKNAMKEKNLLEEEEWEAVVDGVCERYVKSPLSTTKSLCLSFPTPCHEQTHTNHKLVRSDRLVSRLPRMPFPPNTSTTHNSTAGTTAEIDFALEPTLTRISTLQSSITSNAQAIKLLTAQVAREEKALKRDKAELKTLEDGARRHKDVAGSWPLHRVARDLKAAAENDDESDVIGGHISRRRIDFDTDRTEGDEIDGLIPTAARTRAREKKFTLTKEKIDTDAALAPLVAQLRSHLGSMAGNVAGLKGVRDAMGEVEGVLGVLSSRGLGLGR